MRSRVQREHGRAWGSAFVGVQGWSGWGFTRTLFIGCLKRRNGSLSTDGRSRPRKRPAIQFTQDFLTGELGEWGSLGPSPVVWLVTKSYSW